jgi:hypothetical protein
MKSEGQQADWIARQREAEAYRIAADTALHNPWHDERERQERADYYRNQAERLEAAL